MTTEELEQIRQIVREELNARLTITIPANTFPYFSTPCIHEWTTDFSMTGQQTRCKKCGAYPTYGTFNATASAS